MNIKRPKIRNCEEKDILDAYTHEEYNNCIFNKNIDRNICICYTTFDSCIFNDIDFNTYSYNFKLLYKQILCI